MDLDDLLNDSEPGGSQYKKDTGATKSWATIAKKIHINDDPDFDDDDGIFSLGGPKKTVKKPTVTSTKNSVVKSNADEWGDLDDPAPKYKPMAGAKLNQVSFAGGSRNNSKTSLKDDDLDSILDEIDGGAKLVATVKPAPKTVATTQNKFKLQEDDDWNVPATTLFTRQASAGASKKSLQDFDDIADQLLDDLEEKKPKPLQRPKTANNEPPLWSAGRKKNIYQTDDLDLLDEGSTPPESKFNERKSQEDIQERKMHLFGVNAQSSGALPSVQKAPLAVNNNSRNQGYQQQEQSLDNFRPQTGPSNNVNNVVPLFHQSVVSNQDSQESEIGIIDTAFSRQKKMMKRPPTASGTNANSNFNVSGQGSEASNQRPHTGPVAKPGTQETNSQGSVDGLRNKNKMPVNSQNFNFQPRTTMHQQAVSEVGDIDFERATDIDATESEVSYYEETAKNSDDSDDSGGFYMPTAIQKAKPAAAKKKKKKARANAPRPKTSQPASRSPDSERGQPILLNKKDSDNQRKSYTMSGQDSKDMIIIPPQNPPSSHMMGTFSNQQALQSLNENQILQLELEQERERTKQKEESYRKELEAIRQINTQHLNDLQTNQTKKLSSLEKDKALLIEQRQRTLELEKQKLAQLHKIDIEQVEQANKRAVAQLRSQFEAQNDVLRKNLQQKAQMNSLAEEISKSSGNINTLVARLTAQQEGELRKREEDIIQREQLLHEKRRMLKDKKAGFLQRQKKIQQEQQELQDRELETKAEFEKEKKEILKQIDGVETEQNKQIRLIRNKVIDSEAECKKVIADVERIVQIKSRESAANEEKLQEMAIELKQIDQVKAGFRADMAKTEKELKNKLAAVENLAREIQAKERLFYQAQQEFAELSKQVTLRNDQLQEQVDRFSIEKDAFDRKAQQIKQQGEMDHQDSEKIGFFKANKERIREELTKLKESLEDEKTSLGEDRMKLDIYQMDLKQRQKAIEVMRFEYIKATSGDVRQFSDQAKDLAHYKLTSENNAAKQLYPIFAHKSSPPAPAAASKVTYDSNMPRFNYNEYMKNLKSKLELSAPTTNTALSGTQFQQFLLKEKHEYLKSVSNNNH